LFLHLNAHAAFEKVLPSKIFEYAHGKPIWAGVAGHAARFIASEVPNAAVFAPCNVPDAIGKTEWLDFGGSTTARIHREICKAEHARAIANDILSLSQAKS